MTKAQLIQCLNELERQSGENAAASQPVNPEPVPREESALRDSEERIRAILQTAVEGIITIDETGRVESLNPAAQKLFGYRENEVVGSNVSILMPAPFRHEHDQYIQNYVRTGQAKIIGIGREVEGRRKDGTVFPMDLAVSEVHLANRKLFTGFVRDVTERKRAHLRQALQYATVRALAESASLSEGAPKVMAAICEIMGWNFGEFWSVDRAANVIHHVQSWSPPHPGYAEFEVLAGAISFKPGSGIIGRVWAESRPQWISSEGADASFLRVPAAVKEGIQGAVAFPILLGAEVLGVMIFFFRESKGQDEEFLELFGAIGNQIGQFIERKRAEAKLAEVARTLAEKNKELETIVYVASHDLRSPLVNIQGFSIELARACEGVQRQIAAEASALSGNAALQQLLSQEIPEAIDFILAGVKRIDALLSGFLRFSRLGRAALKPERLDMRTILAGIIRTMDFQIKRSGTTLEVQALPACIGDAMQINQVFSNLLDNAIKYLDPLRAGRIVVTGHVEEGRATYAVGDNGIGIAPEHQTKIFEIFHRLNPSATEGEGLGLTIAQRILERQGGRIWVCSIPGQGSTFFVSLPVPA